MGDVLTVRLGGLAKANHPAYHRIFNPSHTTKIVFFNSFVKLD
jgi:hypothetical protein